MRFRKKEVFLGVFFLGVLLVIFLIGGIFWLRREGEIKLSIEKSVKDFVINVDEKNLLVLMNESNLINEEGVVFDPKTDIEYQPKKIIFDFRDEMQNMLDLVGIFKDKNGYIYGYGVLPQDGGRICRVIIFVSPEFLKRSEIVPEEQMNRILSWAMAHLGEFNRRRERVQSTDVMVLDKMNQLNQKFKILTVKRK